MWSNTDDGGAGSGGLASPLLEFFRDFDELEAIKLELANQHLAQLLHANDGLAAPSRGSRAISSCCSTPPTAPRLGRRRRRLGARTRDRRRRRRRARRAAGLLGRRAALARELGGVEQARGGGADRGGDGARSLLGGGDDDEGEESAEGDGEDDLDDDDDDEPPLASPLAPRGYDAGRFAAAASLGAGPSALGAGASLNQHGLGGYYGVGLGGVGGARGGPPASGRPRTRCCATSCRRRRCTRS